MKHTIICSCGKLAIKCVEASKELQLIRNIVFDEVYKKAQQLGRREIPDCYDDWITLMRWLEKQLSASSKKEQEESEKI